MHIKGTVELDEYTNANKLVREKLKGYETTPVAMAMIAAGIDFLIKTRKAESDIREFCEKALAHSMKTELVTPTATEMAKLLGKS